MSSFRAIVVGGSLSGLRAALALAADGAEVVVTSARAMALASP